MSSHRPDLVPFNGRLRDELLNLWRIGSLLEAREIIEDWRADYNVNRPDPNSAHGELTVTHSSIAGRGRAG